MRPNAQRFSPGWAPGVRGWVGYFGISHYYGPIPELDDGIRWRIRMGCWKQWMSPDTSQPFRAGGCLAKRSRMLAATWGWARTKMRNLLDLGVSLKTAIQHGVSSKSY